MHDRLPQPSIERGDAGPGRTTVPEAVVRRSGGGSSGRGGSASPDALTERVVAAAELTRSADGGDATPAESIGRIRRATWIQRAAVTATDKGKGKLVVETGGDMDANHIAADWSSAVEETKSRDPAPAHNTIITDVDRMRTLVGNADIDTSVVPSRLKSITAFRVPGVPLWQINSANAKNGTLGDEPPQTASTVTFKTKLAADDTNKKSRGSPTTDPKGPVFLVTGVQEVG